MAIRQDIKDYKIKLDYNIKMLVVEAKAAYESGKETKAREAQTRLLGEMDRLFFGLDDKLKSLETEKDGAENIVFLVKELPEWISSYDQLSITNYKLEKVFVSAGQPIIAIRDKWMKYCEEAPAVKRLPLLQRKKDVQNLVAELSEATEYLDKKLKLKSRDVSDRLEHPEKYRQEIMASVEHEMLSIDSDIHRMQRNIEALCHERDDLKKKLSSTGFFAFKKKKLIKNDIASVESEIRSHKNKVTLLEERKGKVKESLDGRLLDFEKKTEVLRKEFTQLKKNLDINRRALQAKKEELREIKDEIDREDVT